MLYFGAITVVLIFYFWTRDGTEPTAFVRTLQWAAFIGSLILFSYVWTFFVFFRDASLIWPAVGTVICTFVCAGALKSPWSLEKVFNVLAAMGIALFAMVAIGWLFLRFALTHMRW